MFANDVLTEDFTMVQAFLQEEREKVLSHAEWKFRMRGYGYGLRRVEQGVEVARLPQNHVLGTISI